MFDLVPLDIVLDLSSRIPFHSEASWILVLVSIYYRQVKYRELKERITSIEHTIRKNKPMEIYKQQDERWSHKPLGNSPYNMGYPGIGFGCTTVCVAQLMALAGWNINPGTVNDSLNSVNGYTDNHYLETTPGAGNGQPGLLLWYPLMKAFPEFHWNTPGPYELWAGRYGGFTHWISAKDGVFYDSISGRSFNNAEEVEKAVGVKGLSLQYRCAIDLVPGSPIPSVNTYAPFLIDLSPSQIFDQEVLRVQSYLIDKGFLEKIPLGQLGYYGSKTRKAVDAFQKSKGIVASSKYFGWWYTQTREAANKDLTF